MADPRGFVTFARRVAPYRAAPERTRDHRDQAVPATEALVREQAARCMGCGVPFCHTGCPLGNLVPDWNELVRTGRWREAAMRLHETNNFPEFTGKLCPAPCEEACVLALNDDPVTIKQVELAIVERAFAEGWVRARPAVAATGRSVAIVGSGPAGLAAAQQLARAGHAVTVFERDEAPGGLLRLGIPDFKIEKRLIDRRLEQLQAEGVRFEVGAAVGARLPAQDLAARFDAVLLATGAQRHRPLHLPGAGLRGVEPAMAYLAGRNRSVAAGRPGAGAITAAGKDVVVLGGGDTSADCLGCALREGARSVTEIAHGPTPPVAAHAACDVAAVAVRAAHPRRPPRGRAQGVGARADGACGRRRRRVGRALPPGRLRRLRWGRPPARGPRDRRGGGLPRRPRAGGDRLLRRRARPRLRAARPRPRRRAGHGRRRSRAAPPPCPGSSPQATASAAPT